MKLSTLRLRAGRNSVTSLCLIACASVLVTAAQSQPHRPRPPERGPGWHGDIHRFHEHDWGVWRGGRWYHGRHAGRLGWWWIVGSTWYFYPAPVYPYPNPWEPPPAGLLKPGPGWPPPPAQNWYYCESAKGYYPYVPTCPEGWKQVPATPAK